MLSFSRSRFNYSGHVPTAATPEMSLIVWGVGDRDGEGRGGGWVDPPRRGRLPFIFAEGSKFCPCNCWLKLDLMGREFPLISPIILSFLSNKEFSQFSVCSHNNSQNWNLCFRSLIGEELQWPQDHGSPIHQSFVPSMKLFGIRKQAAVHTRWFYIHPR